MSHGAPRAFPIVMLESMRLLCRLSDGKSVKAASSVKDSNASEEVSGVFELWTRLRAFFTTLAYTSIDQKDWFGFGECEQFVDQVFQWLHLRHSGQRAPIQFYIDAFNRTCATFQSAIRANRTLNSVIGNPSEYQHFWTVFVPTKMDNTVKNREPKSWRREPGTSDYRAGYEKALLTARNIQSERDRVVNELRKLSNETGKGKQYSGQKDRRRDRGPDTEQTQRNKHTRESWWDLHVGPRSVLHFNAPKIVLVFHASLPSGVPRIVNARRRLRQLMVGPGWGPANAFPVDGIYHGPIRLPIPTKQCMWDSAIRIFFFDLHRGAILLCSSLRTSRRPIGSLLSLGVPELTNFNGCLQFLGSTWHVTAVSQNAMLLCLMNWYVSWWRVERWRMKGGSFLLRRLAEIPPRMVQVLHRGMLPQHLRFAIKHNQPGWNPGQCFALKCGRFSVGVFGICFQTIQFCHNPSNRQVGTWPGRWIPISIQMSTCKTLCFSLLLWVYCWKGE